MKHVLIIDDNPEVLKAAEHALADSYRITKLFKAHDVLRLLSDIRPDLILLGEVEDIKDYKTALTDIRKVPRFKELPIIVIAESGEPEFIKGVLSSGADDIITKPLIEEVLINRVETQLELYSYRNNASDTYVYQDAISVSIAELVECRDITTGGHLKNTTAYFKLLLNEVISSEQYKDVIPPDDVRDLIRSAPLHDIGKIGINDDILRKESTLDYHEFEYMKTHTTLGRETFDKIMKETGETRLLKLARDLAYCHHERWDGSGYPNGLKGEDIPLYARILAIADVYDALTSRRTYKEAFPHSKAVEIIREGRGSLFDPDLVDIFIRINDRFEEALKNKYLNGSD